MNLFTSLLTRVKSYVGPRDLPTGTSFQDGFERQAAPIPIVQTRWHQRDVEAAIVASTTGSMRLPGALCRALRRDGMIYGVLSTRTEGLVQLPVRFSGPDDQLVSALSLDFRSVFPSAELALLSGDGRVLGVGVGEFVQIDGSLPVLRRLDPEFLEYRWSEDRWYYQSIHGVEPVNPGDGRWVLHCPGGAVQPWTHGLWPALGRAYVAKEHGFFMRENFANTLANAARIAVAPSGATDAEAFSFMQKVVNWSVNAVYVLRQGWELKLLESQGRGYEVFTDQIKNANEEIIVTIAGQLVTTQGGAGFQNSAIHATIRSDLIQSDANALAETLNTQAIPVWANERFGAAAVKSSPKASWDTTPPKDMNQHAIAANTAAGAAKAWDELLREAKKRVNAVELSRRYGVPIEDVEEAE
ncbi:DUF935 family protein [Sorangium sp. So ce134]